MNLGFLSSMHGGPWGGSEELWAGAARAALSAGHAVRLSILRWRPRAEAIDALAREGASVCERPRLRSKQIRRMASAVLLHDWKFAPAELDVLCISQGGTYDFLAQNHRAAVETLTGDGRVPYVVVCQYNDERSIPAAGLRERARRFFGRAFRVVFVAEHNRRLATRQLACDLPNAVVLNNPVNLHGADPVAWPAPSGEGARLACVARLSVRHKGHDVLLEAMAAAVWQAREWRLRLYGGGPDEPYVRALVRHYGLESRVELMGHVSDIRSLWRDNELLVLPSYGEGTPLSLLEAMLCGRPAVVTDVGGNAEWVDGDTGFVAAAPTARSLGDALERAWSARGRWPAMGEAAHARVVTRYDPTPGRSLLAILEQGARAAAPITARDQG